MTQATTATTTRLETLIGYLNSDPTNGALRSDAIDAAFEANEPEIALRLIGQDDLSLLDDRQLNQAGLAHLQLRQFDKAGQAFSILRDRGVDDPAVVYNLAWARANEKDFGSALTLLDDSVAEALPQAAQLQVELLHNAGEFDHAADRARHLIALHPDHRGLAAAVSVLAIDIEDADLAARCAAIAGDHPDALATMGTLSLGEQDLATARAQFDRALELNPQSPRALIGRGLTKLITEDGSGAEADLDRGAELFENHLGSWIAAGWAYLLRNDLKTARERFEHSMTLDHTFAENFGSLAVIDVLEGNIDKAREQIATAFRLDRQCFSAAMAQSLIASAQGNPDQGRKLFERILEQPLNEQGDTIKQALARMGFQ